MFLCLHVLCEILPTTVGATSTLVFQKIEIVKRLVSLGSCDSRTVTALRRHGSPTVSIMFCLLYACFCFVLFCQDRVFKLYKIDQYQMMFGVNCASIVFTMASLLWVSKAFTYMYGSFQSISLLVIRVVKLYFLEHCGARDTDNWVIGKIS